MKERFKYVLFLAILCCTQFVLAQSADVVVRGTVSSPAEGPLMQVNVVEIDNNDRIITATVTDMNGEFSLKVKSTKNMIRFAYIGYETVKKPIGEQRVFNIDLVEENVLKEVIISGRKTTSTGALEIPEREMSMAVQKISTKEFEGLSVASIDDALQGRIAGLDIVGMSGDLGGGMNMRLRGVSTITGNSQPLIVVDGIIFETNVTSDFDFATATQDQYAELLQISPDDIETITVLKDAAATAVWGAKGSNGVLQFTTKKGVRGVTKVNYTYRYSGAWQPEGYKLLNGDDYTMFMKEAYFNPKDNPNAANLGELSYTPSYIYYDEFNDNTDWVKEVSQYGQTHDHYLTITGGGEKARFRVSGGYYTQTGIVIEQEYDRYSTRVNLDYNVSKRIKFFSEFAFTYSNNKRNYDGLMDIALRKMPNLSIYWEDAKGNDTDVFFAYPNKDQDANVHDIGDQDGMVNPIASAMLAKKNDQNYRILPTFRIQYDLLDPDKTMLRYKGYISFDISNNSEDKFYPKILSAGKWNDQKIEAVYNESKAMGISTENAIQYTSNFANKDHVLTAQIALQVRWGNNSGQTIGTNRLPNGMQSASAGTYLSDLQSGPGEWRNMAIVGVAHYSYQSKYSFDFVLRREGSTRFGRDNKFGNFPGLSARWNVTDEPFMQWSRKWLTMFSLRPSWGVSGNMPSADYLYFSKYGETNGYIGTPGLAPSNIRLTNLKWEKSAQWNFGTDIELFDGMIAADFNYYHKTTTDLINPNFRIPTSSGFDSYPQKNSGEVVNKGWEVNFNAYKFVHIGDFSMDFTFNIANNINNFNELEPSVLKEYNPDYNYENFTYLPRLQLGNSFGSIYGFRYKGVYQYDYNSTRNPDQVNHTNEPVARDASGNVIYDETGKAKQMVYHFGDANQWKFRGGDAIYEDINHDGNIDALDIVYLGNSNPDFNGGMGLKFRYKRLTLNVFSNFRSGNKVVNMARMNLESMRKSDNQCASINWRWRKEGDVTDMPRALYDAGYNSLGSDRYVEDGSFWRIKYITLNYGIDPKLLKKYYLNQLSFYFTMNNIYCFTNYSGVDPEVGYGARGVSTDNAKTPRSVSFTAGISIGF